MVHFDNEWDTLLAGEFEKPYYQRLRQLLAAEYRRGAVYPPMEDIFNALRMTSYSEVRAVILGQDPYHGPGQAHGLAFSVRKGIPVPPSLQNIFRELASDAGFIPPGHGCLSEWAQHGVLLLNATLTVRAGQANSHRDLGWTTFTDRVIELLNEREEPMVFLLWGSYAKAKMPMITSAHHLVLTAAHPSPLSAAGGFFGCRHFSKANAFLSRFGREIDWTLQP
ncbi:MAG: uracil-DNA glycosylase [Provencibacterium sp.]|jgi:uracil-DNA glycosylase|nr:uracil-DNA glycosylase [Provencibacterium sp.]